MPSSNTRVGTYLLWLVIAVSLPIVLFAGGTIWRAQQADRLRERQELAAIAADIAGHADSALGNLQENLLILARSPNLRNAAWDTAKPDIDAAAAQLDATIRVVGTDGRSLVPPSPPENAADIGAALQDPVRRAIEAGAPEVTDLLPEVPDAARSVAVIVPGRLGREATQGAFALAAIPSRAWLQRLVQRQEGVPAGLITALFDRGGTLVARSPDPARSVGHSARPGLLKAMQGAGSGFVDTTTLEGVPAVAAFRRAAVGGYTAAALLPRSELGAARKQDLIATLAVGAGLIGAGLLAAGWLSRRLVHALHLVGHDPTASPPSFGVRELDDLAARLHAMAWEWQGSDTSLRQSEAMLRDLVQMLDQAVIMTRTLDGTIRFWSQGCVRMYGWTPQEAIGQRSHTLLQTQFPRSLTELEQALLEHGTWAGDLVHRRRDGSRIVAAAEMVLRRRQDGTPDLVMESRVDVTALREAEDRLRAINEDLEQRVQAEIDARQAAQQRAEHNDRIQALGQLAGGIAHDFNNILQAIAGGAALIARHPRDTDMVTRFIGIISDAAARGATITRRILLLARRGDLRAEPIDTPALL
ncbi:MAG TPA: PAS domain S-box protein, partial [Rhodopila sp.]|nr:PAS domain S-box protein [Rhodopila sp.]